MARLASFRKTVREDSWGLLLIFQAMDAAGKDGTIKHVMSGVNPQGCQVYSFKARPRRNSITISCGGRAAACPSAGVSGFSTAPTTKKHSWCACIRSRWTGQKLPASLVTKRIWDERFEDIRAFERNATRNGIAIRKFFLHVSRKEQKRRFLRRLDLKSKNWKFSTADAKEREHWDAYMRATNRPFGHGLRTRRGTSCRRITSGSLAWWSAAVNDALEEMELASRKVGRDKRKELAAVCGTRLE